ncbi:MAG: TrpB-like pyridoxal phosphate-dependent enzyme [Chloroflexi bacterium]|nr:TrpB-like pyridoxal phosphate-dependent enzyme [Chloroflexota bacterium]
MRISLDAKELSDKWYNVIPDLGFKLPPPMSPSGYPLSPHDLRSLAPLAIIQQELDTGERFMLIPHEVRQVYSEWRPTPLFRAERFEKRLGTPARIFYKYEGGSPSGSYEFNTAVAQAYYASREGAKGIVTATANGEWGASLAIACNYFNIRCKVYMVRASFEEKLYGRAIMEILGAEVIPSPSEDTRTGKKIRSQYPQSPGSLGIALSEAFEEASVRDDVKFAWGTVMNHVLLHQTVIGLEARLQLRRAGADADIICGAVGGGSAFGGLILPFYRERREGRRMIAVEASAAPSLSKGRYAYDYADAEGLSVLLKMYTLGHSFMPPGIRAGGMRYHGISPLISALYREKQIEAKAYTQGQALEAAVAFAQAEGFVCSPESSYTVKAVMDEAIACREKGERKNILFVLSTNSNLDLVTFRDFLAGAVADQPFLEEQVESALEELPEMMPG